MKKIIIYIVLVFLFSCTSKPKVEVNTASTSKIIVDKSKTILKRDVGLVYYNDSLFTGTVVTYYPNKIKAESIDYKNGKRDGNYKKWFNSGLLSYHTIYKNGKQHGTTKTWWINGNLRSEANHSNGVVEGVQKQWYKSGEKFKELNIVNGQEEGMQRTWRKNGKLYNNYEAKNGRIFGLKRANLCYELKEEDVQYKD